MDMDKCLEFNVHKNRRELYTENTSIQENRWNEVIIKSNEER